MKTQTKSPSRRPRLLTSQLHALANAMLPKQPRASRAVEQQEVIVADAVDDGAGLLAAIKVR